MHVLKSSERVRSLQLPRSNFQVNWRPHPLENLQLPPSWALGWLDILTPLWLERGPVTHSGRWVLSESGACHLQTRASNCQCKTLYFSLSLWHNDWHLWGSEPCTKPTWICSIVCFQFLSHDYLGCWLARPLLVYLIKHIFMGQSILKEINSEYSLERLMLKLQYFGHMM